MSGSRQKKLRKQNQFTKNEILDKKIKIRKLIESPIIFSNDVVEYLLSRFVGKAGYRYISISRHGSLFIHDDYKALVPVILHKDFPIASSLGRFSDPNRKDCVISLVKVDPSFKGVVLGRDGAFYAEGININIAPEDRSQYLCNLMRVTAAEYNGAIQSQEAEYTKKMNEFVQEMKNKTQRLEFGLNPYADNPYDEIDVTLNPYEIEIPL